MSTTHYLAFVSGPVRSYLRAPSGLGDYDSSPARGLEFTESLADAARFGSQAAITTFLSAYTTTLPVQGGTGTPALTVLDP